MSIDFADALNLHLTDYDHYDLSHYQTANFRLFPTERVLQTTISNLTKMAKKLSKQVENTVGKGEIARYEQFLLFPQCFQKTCFPGESKGVIVWEWVKPCRSKRGLYEASNVWHNVWIHNIYSVKQPTEY